MTTQSVLEDRPVSYPLTRAMCAPIGDGAAAALLCSAEYLETLPAAVKDRAIKVVIKGLSGPRQVPVLMIHKIQIPARFATRQRDSFDISFLQFPVKHVSGQHRYTQVGCNSPFDAF